MKILISLILSSCFILVQAEETRSYGGQIYIEDYEGADFGQRLQNAIDAMPQEGGVINCCGCRGEQLQTAPVVVDKPIRILLGQIVLNFENTEGQNMFEIASDGVDIIGLGRSVNSKKRCGKTVLKMLHSAGDAIGGYHIYNRGFSAIIVKDLDLEGLQTTMGHQYLSLDRPLNGAGGIYMERATPGGVSKSGNNISQVILENLYIEKTKAHGVYLDTPMLSTIRNVRVSDAGGHGIFIYRGTTCQLQSIYVSSANYAAFVLYQHAYTSVLNCAAENSGMGWWIRSCRNVTLLSPGVEETKNIGLPWGVSAPYGLNLKTRTVDGDWVNIQDVNADAAREFVGHGFYISGGESIHIIGLYCKDPGSARQSDDAYKSNKTRYLKITANNSNSTFSGLTLRLSSSCSLINDYDVEIGPDVSNCRVEWGLEKEDLASTTAEPLISRDKTEKALILLRSESTMIMSGNKAYTPIVQH